MGVALNCSDAKGNSMKTNPLIFRVKRNTNPKAISKSYAKRLQMAKHELSVRKKSQILPHGPYGSKSQQNYRMVLDEGDILKEVIINHGYIVDAIGFVIQKQGCTTPITNLYGGALGNHSKIVLKRGEYITRISGTYGNYMHGNLCLIGMIRVHTNFCTVGYGPYGQARDMLTQNSFSSPDTKCTIVGFFGRHNNYLESVGVFLKQDC